MSKKDNSENVSCSQYDIELPVDGSDNSFLMTMGLEFGPFSKGDLMRGVNLPPGWKEIRDETKKEKCIVDANDYKRLFFFKKGQVFVRPVQRFTFGRDMYEPGLNILARFCIWDSAVKYDVLNRKVVFEVRHILPDKQQHKDVHNTRFDAIKEKSLKECEAWLTGHNYTDWSDPTLYWNE